MMPDPAAFLPMLALLVAIGGVAGVIAGGLVGWFATGGIAAINAMAVAVVCYLLGEVVTRRRPRELTPGSPQGTGPTPM